MIIDRLANAHLYADLSPQIKQAFHYLKKTDLITLPEGKFEIDGQKVYASVQQYSTKLKEQGKWEAHRRHIDLQYVIHGTERIGYVPLRQLSPKGEYDELKDILFLSGAGDFLTLTSGQFMLLFPEDAHMPGMAVTVPAMVKKIVVKIAVD